MGASEPHRETGPPARRGGGRLRGGAMIKLTGVLVMAVGLLVPVIAVVAATLGAKIGGNVQVAATVAPLALGAALIVLPYAKVLGGAGSRAAREAREARVREMVRADRIAQNVARGRITPQDADIARHGAPARGVVLSAQPTGRIIAGCEEMAVQVRVTDPGGRAYDATAIRPVPAQRLPALAPGAAVELFCAPDGQGAIVLAALLDA
jgi:hypothetical protein